MVDEIEACYRYCQKVTKSQAKNFYYAFITLPSRKRKAIYSAYAFCRLCDDVADESLPLEEKRLRLNEIEESLSRAYDGHPQGPVFHAVADAAKGFHIPRDYFLEVIRGVEMDLTKARYHNFQELHTYCYRVASTVGLICTHVFGYRDPKALDYAVDLGIAMQLTNILRDIKEDAERGRIYIPLDELERFGYTEDELMAGVINEAFIRLMEFQTKRARDYFQKGKKLIPLIPLRSRACPMVLGGIYSRLLDRIEAKGYNVFDGRVRLSSREKLLLTVKLWAQSLIPQPVGLSRSW